MLSGCTDILINDEQYNSIYLNGGGWIQFQGQDLENYLNNDFSIQFWISGCEHLMPKESHFLF